MNPFSDKAPSEYFEFTDGAALDAVFGNLNGPGPAVNSPGTDSSGETEFWGIGAHHLVTQNIADRAYGTSMIARKAAHILPEKAFTLFEGWINRKKKNNDVLNDAFLVWENVVLNAAIDAGVMGRKYSDAYIVFFWDDTKDLSQEFNPTAATKLIGVLAKSKWDLQPEQGEAPGAASMYTYHGPGNQSKEEAEVGVDTARKSQLRIHPSRVVHVPGLIIDSSMREQRSGHNQSIFAFLNSPLQQWYSSKYSQIDMIKGHSLFKLKLKGLAVQSLTKNFAKLINRFKSILMGKKYVGGILLDADREDAEFISRTYSGVDKLSDAIDRFVASNSDIPKAFLLNDGTSPFDEKQLGARYELSSTIETYIRTHVKPVLSRFLEQYLAVNAPTAALEEQYAKPRFISPLQLTRKEAADIKFKLSQSDAIYLTSQTINNETVRTRWEDNTYHDDFKLTGKLLSTEEILEMQQPVDGGASSQIAKTAASNEPGDYTTATDNKKD